MMNFNFYMNTINTKRVPLTNRRLSLVFFPSRFLLFVVRQVLIQIFPIGFWGHKIMRHRALLNIGIQNPESQAHILRGSITHAINWRGTYWTKKASFARRRLVFTELGFPGHYGKVLFCDKTIGGIGRSTVFSALRTVAMNDWLNGPIYFNVNLTTQTTSLIHVFYLLMRATQRQPVASMLGLTRTVLL